jgi:hypothetical protein
MASQPLAKRPIKYHRLLRESIDIRSLAQLVPVAAKHTGFKVVGDDKKNVANLGSITSALRN